MSNICKLIISVNKLQRFSAICNFFRSHHQFSYNIPKTCIYNKLLNTASHKIHSVIVQSTLSVSSSTVITPNSKVIHKADKKEVYYNDIVKAQKDNSILIIDVREKDEINETGKLPGSIHIPMGEVTNTLTNLSEKDFKEKFNREKPSKNTKIILSCRSGKRSGVVQEEIHKLGYVNAYNYNGGWLEWESKQKV